MPAALRAAIKRHGVATIVVLFLFGAFATANSFLTGEEKLRYLFARQSSAPRASSSSQPAIDGTGSADAAGVATLAFTSISRNGPRVDLSAAWSPDSDIGILELQATARLAPPSWRSCDYWWDFSGPTNDVHSVPVTNGIDGASAFFRLCGHSLAGDADGDRVANSREIALGTDPFSAHSDGDRLTDGEELGTAETLPEEDFLWFEISDGYDMAGWMPYYGYSWTGMWGGGHVVGDRTLRDAAMCLDGLVHLVSDSNWRQDLVYGWTPTNDLRTTDYTYGGVTVSAVATDLGVDVRRWGSGVFQDMVTVDGSDYDVFEWRNVGPAGSSATDAPLATFEVIVPHAETNVFYVSYLHVDEGFPLGEPLGVQDSSRRSALNPAEFYTVSADGPLSHRTVRYTMGTNTDPRVTDADWATLGQDADWVRANFTNAEEILEMGYPAWVDSSVGSGLDNGLYRLTARITGEAPEGAAISVGDLKVTLDGSEEYVFLLEKGIRYDLGSDPASFTNVVFSADDDVSPTRLAAAGAGQGSVQDGYWTDDCGEVLLRQIGWFSAGCVVYRPRLMVTPGNWQPTPGRPSETFTAVLQDVPPRLNPYYRWHTSDSSVVSVQSPTARTTAMTCSFPAAGSTQVALSLNVDLPGCALHADYVHAPENPDAHVRISFAIPDVMFANDDDDDGRDGMDFLSPSVTDDDVVRGEIRFASDVFTNGTLRIERIGGYVGDVFADFQMTEPVSAGMSWQVAHRKDLTIPLRFNPHRHSAAYNGAGIVVRWIPEAGYELTATKRFTVVEPVAEPVCSDTTNVTAAGVSSRHVINPCGIVVDEAAYFRVSVEPADFPDERIVWTASNGKARFAGGTAGARGRAVRVFGVTPGDVDLAVQIGDAADSGGGDNRPRFTARVVDWSDVKVTCFAACDEEGSPVCSAEAVDQMILDANEVLRQVGVRLHRERDVESISIPRSGIIAANDLSVQGNMLTFSNLVGHVSNTGGLELYVVSGIRDVSDGSAQLTVGLHCARGIAVVGQVGSGMVFAHEVGHALGMRDIYADNGGSLLTLEEVRQYSVPYDWSGGCEGVDNNLPWHDLMPSGSSRYYRLGALQSELVRRMLMNGCADRASAQFSGESIPDITYGSVFGVDVEGEGLMVPTGAFYDSDGDNTRHPINQ